MNRDEIIRMAREAGIAHHGLGWTCWEGQLERFAALVAAAEREALLSLLAEAESLRDQNTELDKKLALLEAAEASLNAQVSQLEKQLDGEYLMGFEGGREWAAKVCDALAEKDKLSNYYAVAARAIREGKKE